MSSPRNHHDSSSFRIVTTAESEELGVSAHRRLRNIRSGQWSSPSRGLVCTQPLDQVDPNTFHLEWARAEILKRGGIHVASVWSAARIWGLPDYCIPTPTTVLSLTSPASARLRSKLVGSVRLNRAPLPSSAMTSHLGIPVTTLARTVVDCAVRLNFERAVVLIEAALGSKRTRDLDSSPQLREEIAAELDDRSGTRGTAIAWAALDFASALSESVFESRSRVFFKIHRIPQPLQQVEFGDEDRTIARGDFVWEDPKVVGEADGYSKTGNLKTNSERKAQWKRDKERDLYLTGLGYRVVHWTWDDLNKPDELAAKLRRILDL